MLVPCLTLLLPLFLIEFKGGGGINEVENRVRELVFKSRPWRDVGLQL